MGPLYKLGWFDFAYSLQVAGLIGFCFGFLLERAGFGNPRKLVAVFYLRDFAVLKVMFTAIVVCMLGLLYFSVFGWIDLSRVYLLPTYVWPQIVGGLALGVGFVMGGYCPTTSVVATVSGRLDGLVFIVGMILGSFVFAEFFPVLENLYKAGHMGQVTLSHVLGLHSGLIALFVCLMAVGAFWLVEGVEKRFGRPEALPKGSRKVKAGAALILILLGLILSLVNPDQAILKRALIQKRLMEIKEEVKETRPQAEEEQPTGFTIVEDEGC